MTGHIPGRVGRPRLPEIPEPPSTFLQFPVFTIDTAGKVERRIAEQPRTVGLAAPPVRVSLRPGLQVTEAARLLRMLAKQLECAT